MHLYCNAEFSVLRNVIKSFYCVEIELHMYYVLCLARMVMVVLSTCVQTV